MNKNKIQNKIEELNEIKKDLLRKSDLLSKDNKTYIYSTTSLKDKTGIQGSTPEDLKNIINEIMKVCVTYVEKIKDVPYIEAKNDSQRNLTRITPSSNIVTHNTKLQNVHLQSIFGFLNSSDIFHGYDYFNIKTNIPSYSKGDNEIFLTRLNIRLNIEETFVLSMNDNFLKMSADFLNPDDIFFIGVRASRDLKSGKYNITGNIKSSISFKKDEREIESLFSEAENEYVYFGEEDLKRGYSYMWTMYTISDIDVEITDNFPDMYKTEKDSSMNNQLTTSKFLSFISADNKNMDIRHMKLSTNNFTGVRRILYSPRYDLIQNDIPKNQIIVNNIINIQSLIEEALNEL